MRCFESAVDFLIDAIPLVNGSNSLDTLKALFSQLWELHLLCDATHRHLKVTLHSSLWQACILLSIAGLLIVYYLHVQMVWLVILVEMK